MVVMMTSHAAPPPPQDRGPAVPFPPPLLWVFGLALGAVLQRVMPLPAVMPDAPWAVVGGLLLVVAGLALTYTGILTFRRFRTAVYPNRPAKRIVDVGVFAYSRNPMYTGFTIAYVGGVLLTGWLWALLLLPVVLTVLVTQVIHREERHLHARFPHAYAAYCRRVRRWC